MKQELKEAMDWFYSVYPRDRIQVYAFKCNFIYKIWIFFFRHSLYDSDDLALFIHTKKREKHIIFHWSSNKFIRYSALFHELLHNQQYILMGDDISNDIPRKKNPIEIAPNRFDDELAFRYVNKLPPIYLNPVPSAKLYELAKRLQKESPEFDLNSNSFYP
jgi:hypothetical protein